MAFRINEEEWEALQDEPWPVRILYFIIRKHMDYESKISGQNRRISEQFIREEMSWSSRPGRKASDQITQKMIRWWLQCLEKKGLIKQLGNHVFECLLADLDKSVQKIKGVGRAQSGARGRAQDNINGTQENKGFTGDLMGEVGREVRSDTFERQGAPPESGISSSNKNYYLSKRSQEGEHFDNCPHQKIIDLYHHKLPTLPRIAKWTKTREEHLRSRWREHPSIELWDQFFSIVAASKFLTGRVTRGDGRSFKASLDWLILPNNFAKVLEGRYD